MGEKYGKMVGFSLRLRPDLENTAWAAMARFGSIGLNDIFHGKAL